MTDFDRARHKSPLVCVTHTVWAAPLALGGLLHVRVQTDHVVSSGTGVTQNDLSSLLAHLTVILVVRLVAVAVLRLH